MISRYKKEAASSEVKPLARLKMETESGGSCVTSVFTVKNFSSSLSEGKEEGDKKGQHPDLKINSNQQ